MINNNNNDIQMNKQGKPMYSVNLGTGMFVELTDDSKKQLLNDNTINDESKKKLKYDRIISLTDGLTFIPD